MFFTALFDENILTYSEEPCKLLLFMYRYIRRKPKVLYIRRILLRMESGGYSQPPQGMYLIRLKNMY